MTEFQCLKCTARTEAKDLAEAIKTMDHAIGLSKGRPCAGGKDAPIREYAPTAKAAPAVETVKAEVITETSKSTKKSKSDE